MQKILLTHFFIPFLFVNSGCRRQRCLPPRGIVPRAVAYQPRARGMRMSTGCGVTRR